MLINTHLHQNFCSRVLKITKARCVPVMYCFEVQVRRANTFSRTFKTLRDMSGECYIESYRLKRLRELGVGAFATGRTLLDKSAHVALSSGMSTNIPRLLHEQHIPAVQLVLILVHRSLHKLL